MDPASMWTRDSIVFLCKPSALFQLPENQCNPTLKESLVNIFLVKCFISVFVVSTSSWKLQRMTFHLPRDRYTVLLPTLTSARAVDILSEDQQNPPEAQNALGPKTKTPNASPPTHQAVTNYYGAQYTTKLSSANPIQVNCGTSRPGAQTQFR